MLAQARAIKLKRDGEARALRRGPTLHGFGLSWLGTGHDSVLTNTRRDRRLLVNFALTYIDREVRLRDLRSRRRATCSRRCAWRWTVVAEALLDANPAEQIVLPRRHAGRTWSHQSGAS